MDAVIYACLDAGGKVIYVGGTTDLPHRLECHRSQTPWWNQVVGLRALPVPSLRNRERFAAERAVIAYLRPKHNKIGWKTPAAMPQRVDDWCRTLEVAA